MLGTSGIRAKITNAAIIGTVYVNLTNLHCKEYI